MEVRMFSAQLVAYGEAMSEVLGIFIECRIEVELRSSRSSVEVAAPSEQLLGKVAGFCDVCCLTLQVVRDSSRCHYDCARLLCPKSFRFPGLESIHYGLHHVRLEPGLAVMAFIWLRALVVLHAAL